MKNASLHEVAKFLSGLVAADFLWLLWVAQLGKPASLFGVMITPETVLPNLIFDIALFLILVHYGWHIGKIPAMRERSYTFVVGWIFIIVAIMHVWRVFTGADLVIGDWSAPIWLSWLGVAVTTYLAYMSFRLAGKIK
ncbi:MAG TPA: hypothetical protein VD928_00420 [Candidatus Paceibacterota bacterium]|nr:hypothetical protein [Candidatus Paceibacterota bacterium]